MNPKTSKPMKKNIFLFEYEKTALYLSTVLIILICVQAILLNSLNTLKHTVSMRHGSFIVLFKSLPRHHARRVNTSICTCPRSLATSLSLIPVKIKITFVAAAPYCALPLECDAAHVSVHAVVAKAESTCQFLAT